MRVSDHEHIRLQVLKVILRAGPLSRSELKAQTGLAAGTVSQITNDLVRRNMLLEEPVTATVGRPRINLRIKPDGAYAAAAVLTAEGQLAIQIVNLRGEPISRLSAGIDATDFASLTDQIVELIERALAEAPIARAAIRHVGIGLPALVDIRAGIVRWLQTFAGRDYPMAATIQKRIGLPVTIDNGSNLLARAEHWFGGGVESESFSMINIGLGISSARYLNGALLMGANGLSPEFAHVKVQDDRGRACTCGASGCIEAHASLWALCAQLRELDGAPLATDLVLSVINLNDDPLAASAAGRAIMANAGDLLGRAISNHINTTDPGRVLIQMDQRFPASLIEPAMRGAIERDTLPPILAGTTIETRPNFIPDHNKGASAVVLEQVYLRY